MIATVYGPRQGFSSFEVVTRGLIEGAQANGCLAGSLEPDVVAAGGADPAGMYEALRAPFALCSGPYSAIDWIRIIGTHKAIYPMVAPNSSWVPAALWQMNLSTILTPSEWGARVLRSSAPQGVEVIVLPHGLLRGHGRLSKDALASFKQDARFTVLHLAGSSLERKGTYELLTAFESWRNRSDSLLAMVVNPLEWKTINEEVEARGLRKNVAVATRLNASPPVMRRLYTNAHLVCQPSRAEGFGLVPLEALAAGTPVAITLSTGHRQWAIEDGVPIDGVLDIETGAETSINYDPGGIAPKVDPDAIVGALEDAYSFHDLFQRHAIRASSALLEKHSWQAVTKPFFTELKRKENVG